MLLIAGCSTAPKSETNATGHAVASSYVIAEQAYAKYDSMLVWLDNRYEELRLARAEAYRAKSGVVRDSLLRLNDEQCATFSDMLHHTDSSWRATARTLLEYGDGSFTHLCNCCGTDSAALCARIRAKTGAGHAAD